MLRDRCQYNSLIHLLNRSSQRVDSGSAAPYPEGAAPLNLEPSKPAPQPQYPQQHDCIHSLSLLTGRHLYVRTAAGDGSSKKAVYTQCAAVRYRVRCLAEHMQQNSSGDLVVPARIARLRAVSERALQLGRAVGGH